MGAWFGRVCFAVVASVALAGCGQSGDTGDISEPTGATTTGGDATGPASSAADDEAGRIEAIEQELAALHPCALLTDADYAEHGFKVGDPDADFANEGCDLSRRAGGLVLIEVMFRALPDEPSAFEDSLTTTTVGGRDASQSWSDGLSTCAVNIAVTPSSHAMVSLSWSQEGDEAAVCAAAVEIAELVEPNLPG